MQNRKSFIILVAGLLFFATPVLAQNQYQGTWDGLANGANPFTMHILEKGDTLEATIDFPDQGLVGVPLAVKEEEGALKGSFDMGDGTVIQFTGSMKEDGTISGKYTQGYESGTFRMKKAEAKKPEDN